MNATITTNCNALNWIISKAQYNGSEVAAIDANVTIHNWSFVGRINERMLKDIHAFIKAAKQTQKTYGNRVIVDGYEIWFANLPEPRNPWNDSIHMNIAFEVK